MKLIKLLTTLFMGINLFSCKQVRYKHYCYGTDGYFEKEKTLSINTEEAASLFSDYYFTKNNTQKIVTANLDIIYNDCYIFSDSLILYNAKIEEYYLRKTYWINGETKEIKEVNDETLNLNLKIPSKFYKKRFSK